MPTFWRRLFSSLANLLTLCFSQDLAAWCSWIWLTTISSSFYTGMCICLFFLQFSWKHRGTDRSLQGLPKTPQKHVRRLFSLSQYFPSSAAQTHTTQPKRKGNLDLGNKTKTQQIWFSKGKQTSKIKILEEKNRVKRSLFPCL